MASTGAFYLGGTSGKLQWDGTTLTIEGSVTITNTIPAASISGLATTATSSDFANITGATKPANNATVGATWGTNVASRPTELTDGRITTAISAAGLVVSGVKPGIVVSTGGVAGLYLGSDYMGYYNGSSWRTYMDNSGNFYLGGTSGSLTWNGTTLAISGSITSTSGTIGGLTLQSSYISGANLILSSTGYLYLGTGNDVIILHSQNTTYRLWIGHDTDSLAPFRVTKAGALTATGATITGAITATSGSFTGSITSTSGTIGGFSIGSVNLSSDRVLLQSTPGNGLIVVGDWAGGTGYSTYLFRDRLALYSGGTQIMNAGEQSGGGEVILRDSGGTTNLTLSGVSGQINAKGYRCRNGLSGTTSGNAFNLYWTGAVVELWIDNTFIKNL
jgi:hypothetical protein